MAAIIGTNIISSLGFTTEENFCAVKSDAPGIKHYDPGTFGLPEAFMASLIDKRRLHDEFLKITKENTYADFEKAAILSVFNANQEAKIDLAGKKTIFILSTTKGNIDLLSKKTDDDRVYLWKSAEIIARFFGNPNTSIVVSNACISSAAAQIAALRGLKAGNYNCAVVIGIDFLSKFIISGFQSFKALSPELCKPFDKNRCGLNLGEAAATVIFQAKDKEEAGACLIAGAIRNDATHISAPSRTGEGSYSALNSVLHGIDKRQIAFINAHGTATSYNDAMETVAITRSGLGETPVNSLKAFFGHTLGAAGVLESIISICALKENTALKSLGFQEQDFENPIHILKENQFSDKRYFIKTISGFSGVNAALLFDVKR